MRHATRGLFAAALLVLMAVTTALAFAPIDGKWVGTMEGPDGPGQVVLDLRAEGEALTGSIDLLGLITAPIANGKITGSDVVFDMPIPEAGINLSFKGKLEGEKLNLTLDSPMGAQTTAFTRPPSAPAN